MAFKRKYSRKFSTKKRAKRSFKHKMYRKKAYKSRKGTFKKRKSFKRKVLSGRVPYIKGFRPPMGSIKAKMATFKLVSKYTIGKVILPVTVVGTPLCVTTPTIWNSLGVTRYVEWIGDSKFMGGSRPYPGLSEVLIRFGATRVEGYSIHCAIQDTEAADALNTINCALTPIDYLDWKTSFTVVSGSGPWWTWPGTGGLAQWDNCRMQNNSRYGKVMSAYAASGPAVLKLSNYTSLKKTEPAPGAMSDYGYVEYNGAAIAAAYRERMCLTFFIADPRTTTQRDLTIDVTEVAYVRCWDPDMPGTLSLAREAGSAVTLDILKQQRAAAAEKSEVTADHYMDEKDWESEIKSLSIEPAMLKRTESKSPLPQKCKAASHPVTPHTRINSCVFN